MTFFYYFKNEFRINRKRIIVLKFKYTSIFTSNIVKDDEKNIR